MNRRRRIRNGLTGLFALGTTSLLLAAPAFGAGGLTIGSFDLTTTDSAGVASSQAGAHPDLTTEFFLDVEPASAGRYKPSGSLKDSSVELPPGLLADPQAVPQCTEEQLDQPFFALCPIASQVGTARVYSTQFSGGPDPANGRTYGEAAVYNMVPSHGQPAQLAFNILSVITRIVPRLQEERNYSIVAQSSNASNAVPIDAIKISLWGVPGDSSHDADRWDLVNGVIGAKSPIGRTPFVSNPTSCAGPQTATLSVNTWEKPDIFASKSVLFHDALTPPNPLAVTGCERLHFKPELKAISTSPSTSSPTGLNAELTFPEDSGPDGLSTAHLRNVKVTLPRGFTINPSQAEGLGTCSPAQYASTKLETPSAGCPDAAKIGTVLVHTPLLAEPVEGDVYVATPHDNPFNSLLALYVVLENADRGVLVKQAGEVETDAQTGQISASFSELPQLPFESLEFKLREGARAPLVTPSTCGTYSSEAVLTPWSDPNRRVTSSSSFLISQGIGGGACPSGGTPPFHPGLTAGSINNAAGRYSPFDIRLFRSDEEQEITHFSIKLPPGIVGKLAGIPFCSDAAIVAAKARTGPHGGQEELDSPSCPAASEVGHVLVGAGAGSVLIYAPGKVYLAGPYHGSALSIAAITAAKVGPFDLGTVVVRDALKINPETAEVFIDATGSDPIPHIIQGITTHLRDVRAYVDRPEFVLNPTSCEHTSTASTVLGSGLDFASEADDQPITVTSPFQAADCGSLGFQPQLALSLKGGTKRGSTPSFKAVLTARKGDANIGAAQVTLPHSEFLEQAHIKTICTRTQFAQGTIPGEKCPAASVYGHAKAITPLLDEPLAGPVFLRSSSHNLPDLVAALHSGKIDINLVGHIDSVKGGRIRNTFEAVPDAPVTKFTLEMQGGKKGLLVNSVNLCKSTNRALAAFTGQNGKEHDFSPVLRPQCGGKAKKKSAGKHERRSRPN